MESSKLAAWLCGYIQGMEEGERVPPPSIEDIENWLCGYDVAIQSKKEEQK